MRLFVESVLRYGLPADYAGVIVKVSLFECRLQSMYANHVFFHLVSHVPFSHPLLFLFHRAAGTQDRCQDAQATISPLQLPYLGQEQGEEEVRWRR